MCVDIYPTIFNAILSIFCGTVCVVNKQTHGVRSLSRQTLNVHSRECTWLNFIWGDIYTRLFRFTIPIPEEDIRIGTEGGLGDMVLHCMYSTQRWKWNPHCEHGWSATSDPFSWMSIRFHFSTSYFICDPAFTMRKQRIHHLRIWRMAKWNGLLKDRGKVWRRPLLPCSSTTWLPGLPLTFHGLILLLLLSTCGPADQSQAFLLRPTALIGWEQGLRRVLLAYLAILSQWARAAHWSRNQSGNLCQVSSIFFFFKF